MTKQPNLLRLVTQAAIKCHFFDVNNGNQIGPEYPVSDQGKPLHFNISDWNIADNEKGGLKRFKKFLSVVREKLPEDKVKIK